MARASIAAVCDAGVVVGERVAFWSVLAEDTDRRMSVEIPDRPMPVRLTQSDLAVAVDAILGNVFAHTPDGVAIDVRLLSRPGGGALLVIEDNGPGLPGPEVVGRGQSGAGSSGLGLDIVRRSAEASGGSMSLSPSSGGGLRVLMDIGPPT